MHSFGALISSRFRVMVPSGGAASPALVPILDLECGTRDSFAFYAGMAGVEAFAEHDFGLVSIPTLQPPFG